MHRYTGPPTDKLVGRALCGDIKAPTLTLQQIGQVNRQLNAEVALRIGGAGAFLDQPSVEGAAVGIIVGIFWIKGGEAKVSAIRRIHPVKSIGFSEQPPGDRRVGQWPAAKVAGLHGKGRRVAVGVFRLIAGNGNLKFRFTIGRHLEANATIGHLIWPQDDARFEVVVAGDRFGCQYDLTAERAIGVERIDAIGDCVALVIAHGDADRQRGGRQLVLIIDHAADNALPVDSLAGAVDRAVAVEVAAILFHPIAAVNIKVP